MEVKLIHTETFYNTMKYWWDGHKFGHVSPDMLPMSTFVCFNSDGTPVYSTCFYNTDSNLCWIGWQLSNPYVDKDKREGCFDYLLKEIEEYSKGMGYKIMFTTSNTPPVESLLLSSGFLQGDTNVNHYIKNI
tara:strand:+ start:70 stop:465 length:396 start_codon:yes stop_codon:yes gene_type:complete